MSFSIILEVKTPCWICRCAFVILLYTALLTIIGKIQFVAGKRWAILFCNNGSIRNLEQLRKQKKTKQNQLLHQRCTTMTLSDCKPKLWISVYDNFGPILGGLNVLALALCLYLLIRAKLKLTEDDPYLLENVN